MAILCSGEFRYSEIEQGVPKITPKMLSKELKILELNQLVERKVYDSTPVKVTYRLTKHGKTSHIYLDFEGTGGAFRHRR